MDKLLAIYLLPIDYSKDEPTMPIAGMIDALTQITKKFEVADMVASLFEAKTEDILDCIEVIFDADTLQISVIPQSFELKRFDDPEYQKCFKEHCGDAEVIDLRPGKAVEETSTVEEALVEALKDSGIAGDTEEPDTETAEILDQIKNAYLYDESMHPDSGHTAADILEPEQFAEEMKSIPFVKEILKEENDG